MQSFAPGWMFRIWLLNMVPQILIAGGLHWWLYMRKGQGMYKKFDRRDLTRNNGTFTFRNQVLDNIWWTLGSAMTVATVYQWIIYWAMANGYVPTITWSGAPVWFVVWMVFIPMWSGLHFYWVHRLEHHPKLYKYVHAVHHRNVNIGPRSGISNHWYENLLYFTTYFIHLIVPSHPLHVLFHASFQQISPVLSHSGFEKLKAGDTDAARAGDFFHQLHHRYFECNYGTSEIPFDKWFGTYHDGSAEATTRTRAYKKQMYT
ncbi:Fatty acid hydroxylase superfamily protein [Ruegeria atlantica]|uniref:Fatty acid hydroxylase superfamily protein n=1 Tax=Ruegeria atlantica TaxID=81569 RepID=A0A0P1EI84_9RHOB|nr:Fatty acid hydroxylase superfamily protein [Ruegeria atlantica]